MYAKPLWTRAFAPCAAALALAVALAPNLAGAPAPAERKTPEGNRADDLTLRLTVAPATFAYDRKCKVSLALTNHSDYERAVASLRARDNDLRKSSGMTYVFRFKDGTVCEGIGPGFFGVVSPEQASIRPEPLLIPSKEAAKADFDMADLFWESPLRLALDKSKPFALTVVVSKIGLKSNTVFVNGPFDLGPGYDPLLDAKTAQRQKAEKAKQ